jgi:hypothetical protein
VHWLIATDDQVEPGIREALSRVAAEGVFVEGNSFAQFVDVDFFVMVRRSDDLKIKKSARQVLENADVVYDSSRNNLEVLIEDVHKVVGRV